MADENKINPASNVDSKQLISTLKEARSIQGDFQDSIRDSVRELNKVGSSYEKIQGTLNSLKTSTINITKIEKELEKSKANQIVQSNKVKELEGKIGEAGKQNVEFLLNSQKSIKKLEEEVSKAKLIGNKKQIKDAISLLNSEEARIEQIKNSITPQQAAYAAQLKALDISTKQVETAEDYLQNEKDIAKSVGNTGKVLAFTSKYLGIGKDLYGKIVEEARNGETKTKNMVIATGALAAGITLAYKGFKNFVDLAKTGLDTLTGTGGPVSKFFSPFTNLIKQIPFIGGFLGGLADAFANIVDLATGATSKVENFARNLGISYEQSKQINDEFARFAVNSGQAFLNVEKLQNSQLELSKALGINNILSKEILADNIQLQEQAGLELETRKDLAQIALISDKRQTQIFKTIVGQVEAVRRSIGVNLRAQYVIANISKLSGVVGLTFAKYPEKLAKSLAVTKALGLDFQKLDGIASGLLDFESSIAAEFEAQLITGKDINLAKARQLALDNDLTGLAVELNEQLGTSTQFLNMNRIAQESYAKALGMSRDEIADMLRQQEFFAAAGATDLKTFKEKVAQMEKAGTLQSEFLNKLNEEQAQYFLSSTATEKIANFVDKIRQSFAQLLSSDQFKSFIDSFINKLSDPNFLTGIINKLTSFVSLMIKAVGALLEGLDMLPLVSIDRSIIDSIYGVANNIGSISVGGKVASSQVSAGGGNFAPQAAAAPSSPNLQAINLTVQTVVDDHARKVAQRIGLAPQGDYKTGPYGKQ